MIEVVIMKVYLTENDVRNLSEGKIFRFCGGLFKPSSDIRRNCRYILKNDIIEQGFVPILQANCLMTSIYLRLRKELRHEKELERK